MSEVAPFYRIPFLQKLLGFCENAKDLFQEFSGFGQQAVSFGQQLLRSRVVTMMFSAMAQGAPRTEMMAAYLSAPLVKLEQQITQEPPPPLDPTAKEKIAAFKFSFSNYNDIETMSDWQDLCNRRQHEEWHRTGFKLPAQTAAPL